MLFMVALLEREPGVGAHLRPGLRTITVDEYQDVSPLQKRLLDLWLGDTNICVVGDPSQTIYTFAGADPTHLTGFASRYPDAQVAGLERTYRCSPQIADLANRVLAGTGGQASDWPPNSRPAQSPRWFPTRTNWQRRPGWPSGSRVA